MLKYAAFAVVVIAGYLYFDRPNAATASLPPIPKSRSAVLSNSPRRSPVAVAGQSTPAVKTAVSAPLVQDKNKTYTYPEIQKMIIEDDVCALNKAVTEIITKGEPPIYIDALFEALNMDKYKELFGVEGPLFKVPKEGKAQSPTEKFLDALATTDLMYGGKREAGDQDKALKQLEELSAAYPENAAYGIYKMALENQMGKASGQLRSSANQVDKAKFYDPNVFNVRTDLHAHMWDSPAIFHLSRVVSGSIPMPRFHKVRDALVGIDDSKIIEHIGTMLVQDGLNSKKTYLAEEFDTTEYYYGNQLLNEKHPEVSELSEQKQPGKIKEINENWSHYELEEEDCDRTAFDEVFAKLKNTY